MTTTPRRVWTTRALLSWMTEAFSKEGLDSPRLSAELLLAHVIGCERLRLYMEVDRPASEIERAALRDLAKRALDREPVQYLVGEWSFYGIPFKTDRRALIPRPSTETVVEAVLEHCKASPGYHASDGDAAGEGLLLADVCTGSGIIACALAKELPGARVIATDIDPGALELAAENAKRLELDDRIDLASGHLLEPVLDHPAAGKGKLHAIASNPPYIPDSEWADVEPNVKDYEPELALRAGPDGLDCITPLLEHAPDLLAPGGILAIECATSHTDRVLATAAADARLASARIVDDYEGLPRTLVAVRAG